MNISFYLSVIQFINKSNSIFNDYLILKKKNFLYKFSNKYNSKIEKILLYKFSTKYNYKIEKIKLCF